ncbi:hypothetical protein AGRA3207_002189 [Actinomadura graeca]|uniref:NACHT domain-containing protein n=1 Tax=Actinomadura graeca TaxID=2750812 RepID=A0ABX8QRP9_9ACTN|nr:hypothetical protein [Actinomadura graeca]QXJ21345.1 hypothetical protein AGRA3207_002189 [Actinomadura graeca]
MIWPLVGLVLLVGSAAGIVILVLLAPDQDAVGGLVQTVTAVLVPMFSAVVWLLARRPRPGAPDLSLGQAADDLAEQVLMQWTEAARERRLMYPAPVPVRWRQSELPVASPVAEAVGGTTDWPRFGSLPGMDIVTREQLRSGGIADLLGVYGGLESGRMILLGAAGAGKSAAAIRLLLDALAHRRALPDELRSRVPVVVLFTMHGWNPSKQALLDWLAARLANDHTFLKSRDYGFDAAVQLLTGGHVSIVLDGLDEMPETLRSEALQALDEQAVFRLVLLTRSSEILAAIPGGHLIGAAALELLAVSAQDAADYLRRCQVHPLPEQWQRLVDHISADPGSPVAQALDTPLMLTLLRDTYQLGGRADELMDSGRFTDREAVEDHLLGRVLPTAYASRPGQPEPRFPLEQAECWLSSIADRMNSEVSRDLVWWHLPRWVPSWPRVVFSVVVFSLPVGLFYTLLFGLIVGVTAAGMVGTTTLLSLLQVHVADTPQLMGRIQWRYAVVRENLKLGMTGGLSVGLLAGAGFLLLSGDPFWLLAGSLAGTAAGIVGSLIGGMANQDADARTPIDPVTCWRQDRQVTLLGALSGGTLGGLAGGFVLGLLTKAADKQVLGLVEGIWSGILIGLTLGVSSGLPLGLVGSSTWRTFLACLQLRLTGETPIRVVRFLEDARERGVLRTVGPVYQFRHARLQDRLAASAPRRHRRD